MNLAVQRAAFCRGQRRDLRRCTLFALEYSGLFQTGWQKPNFPRRVEIKQQDLIGLRDVLGEFYASHDWRRHAEAHRSSTKFLDFSFSAYVQTVWTASPMSVQCSDVTATLIML